MRDYVITPLRGLAAAQVVLGVGGLFIGTGEFAAMGLLPGMAGSVGVSIPHAGNLISAYALGVVVGSPLLAVLTAQMERRTLLMLLASIVLLGNLASVLAPGFFGLTAARFLAGLPHGAYYGTASIVAAAMVPSSNRAQAIGRFDPRPSGWIAPSFRSSASGRSFCTAQGTRRSARSNCSSRTATSMRHWPSCPATDSWRRPSFVRTNGVA